MRIGVDFDNSIVCYDQVFHQSALEQGLIPADVPTSKIAVRDYLRQTNNEAAWTELQGTVYGDRMLSAEPFPGVIGFFARCRDENVKINIVSHKTRHPFRGPQYDLHQTARDWLTDHGFFDPAELGLAEAQVFFELTKIEKLARISVLNCTHFIDDLPEFLTEPSFPSTVTRFLFDPNNYYPAEDRFARVDSWRMLEQLFFGGEVGQRD